jgi:hypothetical protein
MVKSLKKRLKLYKTRYGDGRGSGNEQDIVERVFTWG